jgi:hypothetical protein
MVNVVPCPMTLCTVTWPLWAATISCTMYSPSPVPPGLVVYSGSKICASCSAGIPLPVSHTWHCTAVSVPWHSQRQGPALGHSVEGVLHQIVERTLHPLPPRDVLSLVRSGSIRLRLQRD